MRTYSYYLTVLLLLSVSLPTQAESADLNGLWTKTTSTDPNNITIFYQEKSRVKAIGFSEVDGRRVIWHAEGKQKGSTLRLDYRYSRDAIPIGWEPEGKMKLSISDDGSTVSGIAKSKSGNWSGDVAFVRVR